MWTKMLSAKILNCNRRMLISFLIAKNDPTKRPKFPIRKIKHALLEERKIMHTIQLHCNCKIKPSNLSFSVFIHNLHWGEDHSF